MPYAAPMTNTAKASRIRLPEIRARLFDCSRDKPSQIENLLSRKQHPAFFDTAEKTPALPLTRFDIADYLGTAPETVARGFARLEREQFIKRLNCRQTWIRDKLGLRQLQCRGRRTR